MTTHVPRPAYSEEELTRLYPKELTLKHVQAFLGLYPPTAWAPSMPSPTIVTRAPGDETLFPNESGCKRFAQLSHAFAQRCADLWNESPEMQYLNKELGKWMPEGNGKIAVDGHPRLSGIMDSLNATLAHGPETRLPSAFYKDQVRETIDKIVVEEWFAGYQESQEYRMLGIGGLVRDMTIRMIDSVEGTDSTSFCISGAHDTTLAAILSSFGAYEKEKWPPFTSHIAMELFEKREIPQAAGSWWSSFPLFSSNRATNLAQKKFPDMTADEKIKLRDYYVRVRFNDRPVVIPGCKTPRKHLEGNETFCTLAAFKEIADKFAPDNWKGQCRENLGLPGVPAVAERAGF
ncbi:hypothetical protein FH972_025661 [Carpinus fangiana]|uniref:Histidine phosphatase superfamily n=1 Tax=Carpinus fangiana TaxID=176857 RepID=A0A5N6L1S1_9ROSI|nr:hypothetical protein FH972_025661 [Carpinus fangiana]